jgi:hypothetical protein
VLRVRAITPITVPPVELARRQARYDQFSPPGVQVTLDDIGPQAPATLDTAGAIRASDRLVAELARATDPERYDVVLPDCVLDPGVDADGPVPVVGLLRLAAGFAAALGPYGSVTRNAAIGNELTRRLTSYGLGVAYVGNDVLDLGFDAITDDATWRAALGGAHERLTARGATTVLNGCSAVDVGGRDVVFDPTRLALALLGAGHLAGLP